MKRSKYINNNKKSNKGKLIIGAIVVLLILIAIYFLLGNNNSSENLGEETEEKPEDVASGLDEQVEEEEMPQNENEETPTEPVGKLDNPDNGQEKVNEQAPGSVNSTTDGGYIEGQPKPTEPKVVKGVLIANKKYPLPSSYSPGEDKTARAAFEKMAQDAKATGFEIVAFSTYRSYEYQETLYNNYVSRDGKENADRYSARPGYSEHQTGLAFDIGENNNKDLWLTEEFGETPAGKWLAENAHQYGFILRYPKGKEAITGYMYESWHFRYLGVDLATKVKASNLTLEEYLNIQ